MMMLLDASALLAVLHNEPGADAVKKFMSQASICAANLGEVATKLALREIPDDEVISSLKEFNLNVIPVSEDIALQAGVLFRVTHKFGLSMGDRLCLATAIAEGLPTLTADRAWANIKIAGLVIKLIR